MKPTLSLATQACVLLLLFGAGPRMLADATNSDVHLVIDARLKPPGGDQAKLIFATELQHTIHASVEKLSHSIRVQIEIMQGDPNEITLVLSGEGEVRQVTGDGLQDWSVRQQSGGKRFLVLRPKKAGGSATNAAVTNLSVVVTAETELADLPQTITPLSLVSTQPALSHGFLIIEPEAAVDAQAVSPSGVISVEPQYLPKAMQTKASVDGPEILAFRFDGADYAVPLRFTTADPASQRVRLTGFQLEGTLSDDSAEFVLTTVARVRKARGDSIDLLSGNVGLTDFNAPQAASADDRPWRMKFEQGKFVAVFDAPGDYPIRLHFHAAVRHADTWNTIDFRVAPSALQPLTLHGLPEDTQFRFVDGARPQRSGSNFVSFLPANGAVQLSWKAARAESEGKLFYSAEMLSQISVSPGLMRQVALVEGKVMQGEITRVSFRLSGEGEITRVQGDQVLAWNIEPLPGSTDRRLVVKFNQPLKETFSLQVQVQTALSAFPQSFDALRIQPEGTTRFAGYFRIVNEGAVRLEVVRASGLSQVAPEQFPENDKTGLFRSNAKQRFVYRFSSASYDLRIQADNVLPEISVSQLATYHLADTEQAIEAEIELDIREAPLRELLLIIPKSYAVARLSVPGMSDYFVKEQETDAQLRIVYGQPVTGRQVVQLRLERNKPLGDTSWVLPRIDVAKAKAVRGHIAASADPGYRLTPGTTAGLTEIATAFFPRRLNGIQVAFRITEPAWQGTLRIERLPQSIQVDAFHLFSIGERIAYGSSVLNYLISGAPTATLRVELSSEYYNVEFLGKDVRASQKTAQGYEIQLHTPVSGAYTLLVTYERPFKGQGETLNFAGARPLDVQSEQGHTIVVSAYQFRVKPANVSKGLLPLEPAEVPAEYRLFFDAPILAAYRYTARPFNLQLVLDPLAQADTLGQVADRAALTTRISKQGQVVTDARYYVKNRGQPHFRLTLPPHTDLWSATVNGVTAVPTLDGGTHLIPLPQRADPNAVSVVELKLASRSVNSQRVNVAAPIVGAPVLLAEWKIEPDTRQRLEYRGGSLAPADGVFDNSGFADLLAVLREGQNLALLVVAIVLLACGILVWRWSRRPGMYRRTFIHLCGYAIGWMAVVFALIAVARVASIAWHERHDTSAALTFLAPIQQAGSALSIDVANLSDKPPIWRAALPAWPALLGVVAFVGALFAGARWSKSLAVALGWTFLFWAALRYPNGTAAFFIVVCAFLLVHVILPAARRTWRVPIRPKETPPPPATVAPAAALIAAALMLATSSSSAATSTNKPSHRERIPPIAQTLRQTIRVEDRFAFVSASVHWQAEKGQVLPLLYEPAVLTRIQYPTNAVKVIDTSSGSRRLYELAATESGTFDIEFEYQVQPGRKVNESGFALPTQRALVNELTVTVVGQDVDVISPTAAFIEQTSRVGASNTVARVVLPPMNEQWVGWRPRSRDTRREKPVFYAELWQLFVPSAGVIEGRHQVQVRPAQGELTELVFNVPAGATITDVLDGSTTNRAGLISLWRFDPDARQLRVTLKPAQSRPFTVLVRSQFAVGPLPVEQRVGLLSLTNAAGQIGFVGVASGPDVQIDSVAAESLSPINLEDFPSTLVQGWQPAFPGLTLRRAFRYSDIAAAATISASAVEPDIRVEAQETLSLGEDRTLLAANLSVSITRAGVFRLSFILPAGLDVESISGAALSHWTELKNGNDRIITMHLNGKTEGEQQFAVTLAGPGVKPAAAWSVPRLVVREASKQRGQLVIVPEQGLRLQVTSRDGATQLDPQKAGIKQKGVLAFRLLQEQWTLSLAIEQVDPWVQVASLQHVVVGEAQVKVAANLQYQIENTGMKSFLVYLPTNADSVQFRGEQVADFLPRAGTVTNGLQQWEVKLHRKVIGSYLLQVTFQTLTPDATREIVLRGVEAAGVNLQRGFVTVEGAGRLQIETASLPSALQPSDWQSVPRNLRQDLQAAAANYTFRLIEASFSLPVKVERHEAARLLPARVNHVTLKSVVSDDGIMLTHVRLDMVPGDKRLLYVTLPEKARFWFAFVNQSGVAPWLDQDSILVPLEQQSKPDEVIAVELFYSSSVGQAHSRKLDLKLLGPKFDLPLEDITWQVFLNDKWKLTDWGGTLQLSEKALAESGSSVNLDAYMQQEAAIRTGKTKVAEQQLQLGNTLLARGEQQQARQAFQNAFGLSQHDMAFNEDARVQLHNVKMQQALVGLTVRQSAVAGQAGALAAKLRELRSRSNAAYTPDEAKQLLDRNPAEENAALTRLAERMIQQQDAAVAAPAAIRAAIPEQGRVLTFKRTVQVDTKADLRIDIEAKVIRAASVGARILLLVVLGLLAAVFIGASRFGASRA